MTAEEKLKEDEKIEKLASEIHQFTEEFKTWVNGDFKQLSTMVDALVVKTDVLVKQMETCVKLSDNLVVLSARVAERSKEALLKVEKLIEVKWHTA